MWYSSGHRAGFTRHGTTQTRRGRCYFHGDGAAGIITPVPLERHLGCGVSTDKTCPWTENHGRHLWFQPRTSHFNTQIHEKYEKHGAHYNLAAASLMCCIELMGIVRLLMTSSVTGLAAPPLSLFIRLLLNTARSQSPWIKTRFHTQMVVYANEAGGGAAAGAAEGGGAGGAGGGQTFVCKCWLIFCCFSVYFLAAPPKPPAAENATSRKWRVEKKGPVSIMACQFYSNRWNVIE